jgi:hypothetical protein
MSQRLISLSPDLQRLRDEGYDIEARAGYLVVKDVPYVNALRDVRRGVLTAELTLAGDATARPGTHVVRFAGEHPCHKDGSEISQIKHSSGQLRIDDHLVVDHMFSSKPAEGYADYYDLVSTYVAIISGPAQSLDAEATAMTFPVVEASEEDSVFNYVDTASSRAGIVPVSKKLEGGTVAVVGLGGTGSYVLDLVSKTPVKEIHLFDGDILSQHNAFRSPGAPSLSDLRERPYKAAYYQAQYSRMRRGLFAHNHYIDGSNVDQLRGADFVFLCLDRGGAKRLVAERLEEWGIPFADAGMGVELVDESLLGILRVTTSTPSHRGHVRRRVSFSEGGNDDYSRNIQIAELNALNATLAVIKWKKLCGFYVDLESEHHTTYTISGNVMTNEDRS